MYTDRNFKSKKELKAAVQAYNAAHDTNANAAALILGNGPAPYAPPVTYHQPGPFGGNEPRNGTIYCKGPHYPKPHCWYAECTVRDGAIVKVK